MYSRAGGARRRRAFFEPCHELYPSQLALFGMRPRAVTLTAHETDWAFDAAELEAALRKATLFLFNDPHNPTGHRFSPAERRLIVKLCRKHGVLIVTDEIYEWILYGTDIDVHEPLAVLDPENVVIVSSISKTARATGWRIGWVVASASRTQRIRAVHDQLVACVATPLQIRTSRGSWRWTGTRFTDIWEEYWAKRRRARGGAPSGRLRPRAGAARRLLLVRRLQRSASATRGWTLWRLR